MKYNFNKSYWQNMRNLKARKQGKIEVIIEVTKDAEYYECIAKLKKLGVKI